MTDRSPAPQSGDVPKASRHIDDLLAIMTALRTPGTGCPWDLAQTFETILPYTLEEAQEVAEAIKHGDRDALCDELGDLLFQVVFHARLAEEERSFDFGDVVLAITAKMIRRHPHVFGGQEPMSPDEVNAAWITIKKQEQVERAASKLAAGVASTPISTIDGVLSTQPALKRAFALQKKAATVGFDWDDIALVLAKAREEIAEIEEAIAHRSKADLREEIGDLLFVAANLARHADGDPEAILHAANDKFERRFKGVERCLENKGQSIAAASLDDMETCWAQIKRCERT